jgi:hypothetical protein
MARLAQFRRVLAGQTRPRKPDEGGPTRMKSHAAITLLRPRDEVQRLWQDSSLHPGYLDEIDARVTFYPAPGDRGTEIHVTIEHDSPGGKVGEVVDKVRGVVPRAKAMDELRRFKQRVETGVIVRSDGSPEGELAERKLDQRPAQPLKERELAEVGVS